MDNPVDDSTTSHNTRSDQICSTEVIDITIEDAKNKKEMVNSAMDSVLSLLSKVEQIEKFAEGVAEARRYTLDIFAKMEEHEHMQQSAKEANDKHAKEVYTRKAALATEMKKLQLHVSDVLNEENVFLTDLDERIYNL